MRGMKILTALICLITVISICSDRVSAAAAWDIENTLDVSECRQGDVVTMTVSLKGANSSAAQEIVSMSGTLEYDTSLFTVEKADIFPADGEKVQECSFDQATGIFQVQYTSDRTVRDGGSLLQIQLHTAADADIGKTTLCVTQMNWKSSKSAQATEVEHRVPAKITIAQNEAPAAAIGDVNQDGTVNLTDVRLVMQHYNGAAVLEGQQVKNADTNGDGKVNLTDAKRIMQYYNGELEGFD